MAWMEALSGGIGLVTDLYSSGKSADAAKAASKEQQNAAMLNALQQQKMMKQQRIDSQPYMDSGYNALNQLNYLMGLGSPTAMAKIQENFDPAAYTDWRIEQMKANVMRDFKNPAKQEKVIAKRTARIKAAMQNPSNAWADYRTRLSKAPNKVAGEFWKTREGGQGQGQTGEDYGFLQRRFNNQEFEKDPGYQFRMDEGNKAVEGGAAARGGLLSGAAMKAMQKYSQGFASNEYGNAYNRFTNDQGNMYNRLAGIAGTGQQQMNTTNAMMQSGLNNVAQQYSDAAAAKASGIVGANNARQSGYQNVGNGLMNAWGSYQANKSPQSTGSRNNFS